GARFPVQVSAMGNHAMFDDDQETPNILNATYYFEDANGKRKVMELEIRHWITNHEAEIGSGSYGSSGVPPAGLKSGPSAATLSLNKPAAGPVDSKTNTIGNIFYGSKGYLGIDGYDSY